LRIKEQETHLNLVVHDDEDDDNDDDDDKVNNKRRAACDLYRDTPLCFKAV
jgi:hypothetical protein